MDQTIKESYWQLKESFMMLAHLIFIQKMELIQFFQVMMPVLT